MTASVSFLSLIVYLALAITVVAPLALLIYWIKDWKNNQLW